MSNVDFHIPAGQRVAVIGETGSGKSTLVHLLARFWNPVSGHIRLGENEIDSISEADLRRLITVVSQQPHMFNATLKENLLLACPGAGDDELLAALHTAQLLEFVKGLPDGLNTWTGEAGQLLSGGQARRVAVARAILHNAPDLGAGRTDRRAGPDYREKYDAGLKAANRRTHPAADYASAAGSELDGSHPDAGPWPGYRPGKPRGTAENNARYAALHKRIA